MNIKLVDSIATIIGSLTLEEKELLQSKINLNNNNKKPEKKRRKVLAKILERREGKPFNPPLDDYINITRDERTAEQHELIRSCFGGNKE